MSEPKKSLLESHSGLRSGSNASTMQTRKDTLGFGEPKPSMVIAQTPSVLAMQTENKAKRSAKKEGKVRIRLPVIESYEKELEYTADAPGRVVVRLERLMGTDRIRVTDPKYMNNLFKQLEADEQKLWVKRSKQRKQSERNRFRQLAIEGHMEPGPDMQDLYQHPVFRVNRILDRLAKLDSEINVLDPAAPLPPITAVEPFEEYSRTAILFAFHPDHYRRTASTMKATADNEYTTEEIVHTATSHTQSVTSTVDAGTDEEFLRKYERESGMITTADVMKDEEWGGEDYDYYEEDDIPLAGGCNADLIGNGPLSQIERFFGIPVEERMERTFTPHRSPLVDRVYNEENGGANEVYSSAKEVLETYKREQLKADNVVHKLHRTY